MSRLRVVVEVLDGNLFARFPKSGFSRKRVSFSVTFLRKLKNKNKKAKRSERNKIKVSFPRKISIFLAVLKLQDKRKDQHQVRVLYRLFKGLKRKF